MRKAQTFVVGADFIKTFLYTIIFNSRKCLELLPLGFTVKKKRRILAYLEFKSYYKFSFVSPSTVAWAIKSSLF